MVQQKSQMSPVMRNGQTSHHPYDRKTSATTDRGVVTIGGPPDTASGTAAIINGPTANNAGNVVAAAVKNASKVDNEESTTLPTQCRSGYAHTFMILHS